MHQKLIQCIFTDNHEGMMDPMDLLDPELRPIPPQPGCEPSMQIYQDHRKVISLFHLNSNVLEMFDYIIVMRFNL